MYDELKSWRCCVSLSFRLHRMQCMRRCGLLLLVACSMICASVCCAKKQPSWSKCCLGCGFMWGQGTIYCIESISPAGRGTLQRDDIGVFCMLPNTHCWLAFWLVSWRHRDFSSDFFQLRCSLFSNYFRQSCLSCWYWCRRAGLRRKYEARQVIVVIALCSLQCFNTVDWVTGRKLSP